jgi:excisionase family DNA binding protein
MANLLRTAQAAELLGISASKLEHMRCVARGPTFVKIGRQVRYRIEEIDAYLEACTQHTNHK